MPVIGPTPTPTPTPTGTGIRFGGFSAYGTGGCGCCETGCNCANCGTCLIPHQDLTVSWNNLIFGPGSVTLPWNGTTWVSTCANQLLFAFGCVTGVPVLSITYYLSGSCPTGQGQTAATNKAAPFQIIQDSLTCASGGIAFQQKSHVTSASNPNLSAFGYTTFQVDGPTMPSGPLMCATFYVGGCNKRLIPPPSMTVTVYGSMGGPVLASGDIGPDGSVTLYWTGNPGNYYVTSTSPSDRLLPYAGTVYINCNAPISLYLENADGYSCLNGCAVPIKNTLHGTWSAPHDSTLDGMEFTLTNPGTLPDVGWSYSFVAGGILVFGGISMTGGFTANSSGLYGPCNILANGPSPLVCPTSFAATYTIPDQTGHDACTIDPPLGHNFSDSIIMVTE